LAGWAKKLTGKPSIAVGSVGLKNELYESFGQGGSETSANIDDVAKRVAEGEFDLVGVGRALIADPAWPQKSRLKAPAQSFDMRALAQLV
jgi:2,4-dienoyl-CoA reductase-like NADH-dependent reductase (Old Yellow Enzyme family)